MGLVTGESILFFLCVCFLQAVNSDFRAGWGDDGEEKDLLFESESKQTG